LYGCPSVKIIVFQLRPFQPLSSEGHRRSADLGDVQVDSVQMNTG
jgi:hypothetical protein